MLPYYLLIVLPILLSAVPYSENKKVFNKKFPLLLFFLAFIILLSLRDVTCGVDLVTYRYKFNHPKTINFLNLFDFSRTAFKSFWFSVPCCLLFPSWYSI